MTREQELNTISEVLHGNTDAFEALVTENERSIFLLAYRMTNSQEDACDITQEAFLKAYKNLADFQGECRFSTWLSRIATNCCLDYLRKAQKTQAVSLETETEDGETEIEIPDERFSPEKLLLNGITREAISRGLMSLKPELRQVLVLREVKGCSYQEICEITATDLGTVKSRISRARNKLCAFLTRDGNLPEFFASNKTGR